MPKLIDPGSRGGIFLGYTQNENPLYGPRSPKTEKLYQAAEKVLELYEGGKLHDRSINHTDFSVIQLEVDTAVKKSHYRHLPKLNKDGSDNIQKLRKKNKIVDPLYPHVNLDFFNQIVQTSHLSGQYYAQIPRNERIWPYEMIIATAKINGEEWYSKFYFDGEGQLWIVSVHLN